MRAERLLVRERGPCGVSTAMSEVDGQSQTTSVAHSLDVAREWSVSMPRALPLPHPPAFSGTYSANDREERVPHE